MPAKLPEVFISIMSDKLEQKEMPQVPARAELKEGEHYYINEKGYWVFTEKYHRLRGYCCKSGCKHCPYGFHD
jgi:hypothetical protein